MSKRAVSTVAFRISSRICLAPSFRTVKVVASSLTRPVQSRFAAATPFVNLRSLSTTPYGYELLKDPAPASKGPSKAASVASQIPTDIQEAKQIVERLSSAQVRAMFEAISAKKSSPDDIFTRMDQDGISVYICDAP